MSVDIREFSTTSWRNVIGVVPQDPVLFTGTIASNIAYGNPDATREQIESAAREANCEFVWGMPKGFDTESLFTSFPRHEGVARIL
jgi:putative ABC transport system ATP-binding protein